MNYKMIVLDLDDTLLKNDGTISRKTKKALGRAQNAGVTVVLASGRPTYAIRKFANELDMANNGGFIISYNGARIIDCQIDAEVFGQNLKKDMLYELFDLSKQYGAYIQTYEGDKIITSATNEYTDIEQKITGMEIVTVKDFKNYIENDVVKAIMLQEPEKLKRIEEKLRPIIGNRMYMTISKPFFLEFMNADVDKSRSVERLCKHLNIMCREVIAIGDSYNDISMITSAGLGVAMKNAVEGAKKVAKYITDDNENDGVAKVIDKFILNY